MKFHPDVLRCHEQFGGDLEDMQRRYDAADALPASKEVEVVAEQWLHYDPVSGEPIWHYERVRNGHTSTFSRALYTAIPPDSYAAMWKRQAKTIGELQNEIDRLKQGSSLNDRSKILTENFDQDHHITSEEASSFRLTHPPTDAGVSEALRLREALERISALTPAAANAATSRDLYLTVRAIADTALSTAIPAGDGVPTEDAVERASAAYAKATGYYVEFHRGLRSESSDKIRRGIRAALSTASTAGEGIRP